MKLFSGNNGYAGFYGPSATGNDVIVTIARASTGGASGNNAVGANSGFLADTYDINWGRSVNIKRVFNNNQPIAIVGYGQGTVTLTGLLGTYEGFETIVGGSTAVGSTNGNADLCNPLVITISGSGVYNQCENWGIATGTQGGISFELTGCLLSSVRITGNIESQSGTMLQQANVTFSIGGFELKKK